MPLPDLQHILSLIEQGQTRAALSFLEHLVEQAPSYTAARVVLARTYEATGQWHEAFEAWQETRFFAPDSPVVTTGLRRVAAALSKASQRVAATPAAPAPEPPAATHEPPAATHEPPAEASPAFEDLDRLIEELESARIVPAPDLDKMPAPDLDDEIGDMVSETLARIYEAQNQYEEAARVYEQLATQKPDRAAEYTHKASEMRTRSRK